MKYTDEEIKAAIEVGIFTESAVNNFKVLIDRQKNTYLADEENFRLVASFNDIFVVIALTLLFVSIMWIFNKIGIWIGALISAYLAWKLSEIFITKKHMAFPAILLVSAFIFNISMLILPFTKSAIEFLGFQSNIDTPFFITSSLAGVAAGILHWKRFRVPITVAACCTLVIGYIFAFLIVNKDFRYGITIFCFFAGAVVFIYALVWDASDTKRLSKNTDVAFWLHLLAAPLLVHPIFTALGIFDKAINTQQSIAVIIIYFIIGYLSLIIDRRALMVSALGYVLYTFGVMLKELGAIDFSFAFAGLIISAGLLTISVFWHQVRKFALKGTPQAFKRFVPE